MMKSSLNLPNEKVVHIQKIIKTTVQNTESTFTLEARKQQNNVFTVPWGIVF
jgi:hypothetical protein